MTATTKNRTEDLLSRFRSVRAATERLCAPLEPEDMVVQSMPDVSPTKWHLAHVSWFFETFVLAPYAAEHEPFHARFGELFNSYYQAIGTPFPRAARGLVSRPTVAEVLAYRAHVDAAMAELLEQVDDADLRDVERVVTLGLQHEEQHQELLLMDIKHVLAQNPLRPAYRESAAPARRAAAPRHWIPFEGGNGRIGARDGGFAFDNERPSHPVLLRPFELASRPVTVGEFLEFVADGGYERHEFWLSDGWDLVRREGWTAPLYWQESQQRGWETMTLRGPRRLDPAEPVCHVSYYEADAFASWAGCRLPTEFEWEHAAASADPRPGSGRFLESDEHHPGPCDASTPGVLQQMFGDVWEWTSSAYAPYPGFEPLPNALGEYNGKFMANQFVLRGGSAITPRDHVRATYRNFYYPHQRWMLAGFRLAR